MAKRYENLFPKGGQYCLIEVDGGVGDVECKMDVAWLTWVCRRILSLL